MAIRISWSNFSDEDLLNLRLRDLPVTLRGTQIERRIKRLYQELEDHGISFRPHVWISEEFFTPDGVAGFAIPFYLTHPRLIQLERKMMLEVEGGNERQCMRILRHEAGHALDNAYGIRSKQSWRNLFGPASKAYPKAYKPIPNTRKYVLNLDAWYAQAHSVEDFAETFAVWLRPGGRWRSRYKGLPALNKLLYVDQLMKRISMEPPKNRARITDEPLSQLSMTLREHYRKKRALYTLEYPSMYDQHLQRIFSVQNHSTGSSAATFLREHRSELSREVSEVTGVHRYTVDHVLKSMIERTKNLKLRVAGPQTRAKLQSLIMLTVNTMNIVHSGRYRFWYGL